jgi:hypothetical protein
MDEFDGSQYSSGDKSSEKASVAVRLLAARAE